MYSVSCSEAELVFRRVNSHTKFLKTQIVYSDSVNIPVEYFMSNYLAVQQRHKRLVEGYVDNVLQSHGTRYLV